MKIVKTVFKFTIFSTKIKADQASTEISKEKEIIQLLQTNVRKRTQDKGKISDIIAFHRFLASLLLYSIITQNLTLNSHITLLSIANQQLINTHIVPSLCFPPSNKSSSSSISISNHIKSNSKFKVTKQPLEIHSMDQAHSLLSNNQCRCK